VAGSGRDEHPGAATLEAFALGRLAGAEAARIETHLARCRWCVERARDVPDDALLHLLRRGKERSVG
jgi:hypothetical protein